MGVLGGALGYLVGILANPSSAGPTPITADELAPLVSVVRFDNQLLDDVLGEAHSKILESQPYANEAALGYRELAQAMDGVVRHIIWTIIPGSIRWVEGDLVRRFIAPMQGDIAALKTTVGILTGRVNSLQWWQDHWIIPRIESLYPWWLKWSPTIDGAPWSLVYLLRYPEQFSQYLAAPMTGVIVSYLGQRAHKTTRDNLTMIMLNAFSEQPAFTLDAMERWLLQPIR